MYTYVCIWVLRPHTRKLRAICNHMFDSDAVVQIRITVAILCLVMIAVRCAPHLPHGLMRVVSSHLPHVLIRVASAM